MLKSGGPTLAACCAWATLCLGLPAIAGTLNGLKPGGLALGYWFTAQGAPLALAGLAIVFAARRGRPLTESLKSDA